MRRRLKSFCVALSLFMRKKGIYILIVAVFGFIGLTASSWNNTAGTEEDFLESRAELLMRDIGHQTLRYAGDSVSRVLPVKRLSDRIFQIPFEREFSFAPDTLVKIVERSLAKAGLGLAYRVSVFDCQKQAMVYGFEISKAAEIVPCQGRVQPKGCYTLQVAFLSTTQEASTEKWWWAFGATALALIGLMITRRKETTSTPSVQSAPGLKIGSFQFVAERRLLIDATERVELSDKETRILRIFAARQNQAIDRDEIMKEVWENEGVIVGRSLDVFVSKLRKKLQKDPSVRIVNVHGKGYKLEVD